MGFRFDVARRRLARGNVISAKHRKPFQPKYIVGSDGGLRAKFNTEYKKVDVRSSDLFCNFVMMAFESALMSGGWRVGAFTDFFLNVLPDLPVELVDKIDGRLYPVIMKSNGRVMSFDDYNSWYSFAMKLHEILYGD